VPSDLVIFF